MIMLRTSGVLCATVSSFLLLGACSKTQPPEKPAGLTALPGPAAPVATINSAPPPPPPPTANDELVAPAPGPNESVMGTITLPAARKANVAKGDIIFLVARRTAGPAGPGSMLAVQKLQAGDFPMPFSLSSRDAMIPGTPFTGEISITVRVDKDGDAMTRKKGDVFGAVNGIKVGSQNVVIPLDSVQSEDKVLGGGGPPPGTPLSK